MLIIINGCGIAMNVKKRAHSSFMAPFSCRVLDKMMLYCPACSTEEAFGCEALKGGPFRGYSRPVFLCSTLLISSCCECTLSFV